MKWQMHVVSKWHTWASSRRHPASLLIRSVERNHCRHFAGEHPDLGAGEDKKLTLANPCGMGQWGRGAPGIPLMPLLQWLASTIALS